MTQTSLPEPEYEYREPEYRQRDRSSSLRTPLRLLATSNLLVLAFLGLLYLGFEFPRLGPFDTQDLIVVLLIWLLLIDAFWLTAFVLLRWLNRKRSFFSLTIFSFLLATTVMVVLVAPYLLLLQRPGSIAFPSAG